MNIDKSNSATPVGTDKIVISRQDIAEYTCTLDKLSDYVESNIPAPAPTPFTLPYKSYVALLNQTGTNPPIATILNSDFSILPTQVYVTNGQYNITSSEFTKNKTFVNMSVPAWSSFSCTIDNSGTTAVIRIASSLNNNYLTDASIEIRVYN